MRVWRAIDARSWKGPIFIGPFLLGFCSYFGDMVIELDF